MNRLKLVNIWKHDIVKMNFNAANCRSVYALLKLEGQPLAAEINDQIEALIERIKTMQEYKQLLISFQRLLEETEMQ